VAGSRDLLWGGLVIFLVAGTGAAGPVVFRGSSGPAAMLAGCLALLAGAVLGMVVVPMESVRPLAPPPPGGVKTRYWSLTSSTGTPPRLRTRATTQCGSLPCGGTRIASP
jgi:hypothetical protein